MKHFSFLYTDKEAFKKAQKQAKKKKYTSQLIQVFTSHTEIKKIQKLLDKLHKKFPSAIVMGTTTAGEISHAKMYENSSIISVSLFKKTKLQANYVEHINKQSGKKISKKICTTHTKAAVVLSEGLSGEDYEGFIKGIKKENPKLIISGGLAGDNFLLEKTYIFLGKKIYSSGAVGVSFSGKDLYANNNYNLNWSPIGKKFTITQAKGNIISKIDGVDAVTMFKRYLGDDVFSNNAAALPDFQLLYKEGTTTVARTPMAVEGKSLIFAAPIKENQEVQFGFSNASAVVSGSQSISQKMTQNPAQAIYVYSCIARKTLLGKTLEKEFSSFESIAPTSGFFTYGEFYSTNANNALLNCTTTILVLSESKEKKNKSALQYGEIHTDLENITFNALTHFIEQTSSELKENLELLNQYKSTVDMTSLISKTDTKGIITYVNDNFCKTSKYSREELMGQNHNIIRNPAVSSFVFKKMWHNISSGKVWKGLLSNRAKDGTIYYVDVTINPIFDEQGKIKEYIAIRQDITKQIQSKKRIQEKEKLIKAIFDNQDSIVIYASKTKGMLNVNKKLFDKLNYNTLEEFKSKHSCICDLFLEKEGYTYPTKYPNWIDEIANGTAEKTKAQIILKDNKIHTFKIIIKRIDDEYIINLYDITELEEALHKAHMSEQAKSTFLANMSHEIRTPLNGILGFTDILTKKDLDKDSKRYIDIIHKSGQTLLNVVNDILDFSKLESGELSLYENESNLFEEMEAAVSTFASVSRAKELDYYTFIDTNIPKTLKCDIQRIKQVLNNLASNAIKFTPKKGEVSIKIQLKEIHDNNATIHFSVKDSGIGIAKEKLASVFQAFSQADNSISREFGGTGLGLAISSQYIQMMNSELKVKSEEGKGSEFYFTLTLPIINNDKIFSDPFAQNGVNIKLLNSNNQISCGINAIVSTYLDAWQCEYRSIQSPQEIDENTDILIVCAKLFDHKSCQETLNKYEDLQLIYIEGSEEKFQCSHPQFHLIEQPMTGSALFDKIITLTNKKHDITQTVIDKQHSSKTFDGDILVAEDNETNQILISIMLEERGLNFTIVSNGQEAVDAALAREYDIVFMDINMPVLDGVSATKILREKGYTKPIISLSANVIESDIISFKEAGVDATLNKPLVPHELDATLAKYIFKKEKLDNNIKYDTIDIDLIAEKLSINNPTVIKTLLKSFASTAQKLVEQLKENGLDSDIAHNIKGVAGNLRFTHLYELAVKIEPEMKNWSEEEYVNHSKLLVSHLENILEQIKAL
jgi:PAS domain S-box-containing protein